MGYLVLILISLLLFVPLSEAKNVNPRLQSYSKEVRSIIKLGKRGGDLSPVSTAFKDADNQSFIDAIDTWNAHNWKVGSEKFKKHLKDFPNSPWAGESELHIGCYLGYQTLYPEAKEQFSKIVSRYPGTRISHKALQRLAGVYYLEGDYQKALDTFKALRAEKDVSWQELTYALHWWRHLSRVMENPETTQLLNQCGLKSLAFLYEAKEMKEKALEMDAQAAEAREESTFGELLAILRKDFPEAAAIWTDLNGLRKIHLPVVAYMDPRHFVLLRKIEGKTIEIQDPYAGDLKQSEEIFLQKWTGKILVLEKGDAAVGPMLPEEELNQIQGGCCGSPVPEPNLGNNTNQPTDGGCGGSKGSPTFRVNMINFNLMVEDTPLYYTPGKGLPVEIILTFNTGDAAPPSNFGNKWSFNYDTHYLLNPDNNIVIIRPDGRRDTYLRNADNTFTPPSGIFDTLTDNNNGEYTLYLKKEKLIYHYNNTQNLAYIEDRWGNRLNFFYDPQDQLDYMTDALGQTTDFTLDADGRIIKITDPFGRHADFTYTPEGNLETATDMGGYLSSYTYQVNTETSGQEDLAGTYDVTSITTPSGTTTFKYIYQDGQFGGYPPIPQHSGENYHILVTNPQGDITEYYWDGNQRTERVTRGIHEISDAQHTNGFIDYDERKSGITTIYLSDSSSRVSYIYRESDQSYGLTTGMTKDSEPYIREAYYTYNSNGLPSAIANAYGKSMTLGYDTRGNVISIKDYLSKETKLEYDARDNLITKTDPLNHITRYEYGGNDNLTQIILDRPDPETDIVTNLTYTLDGKMETVINPMNKITTYGYDTNGHLISITPPSGYPMTLSYDPKERLASVKDSSNQTLETYTYDDLNRLIRIDYPDLTFKQYTYACCRIESETDRGGNTTAYGYDGAKRLTSVTDPANGITRYTYDLAGRLTEVIDAENRKTAYTLNPLGWITQETKDDGTTTKYTYDALGRITQKQDGEGRLTTYTYDDNSRLTRVDYSEGDSVSYTYYDNGLINTVTDAGGTTTYTYDDVGRLDTIDGPAGNDLQTYTYDDLFNVTSFQDPRYGTVLNGYDYNLNRLHQITDPNSNLITYTYTPDTMLNLKTVNYPNNTLIDYTYDTQHRLTDVINKTTAGTVFASYHYNYNNAQNRDKLTLLDASTRDYGYDAINRLIAETARDPLGAPVRTDTFGYDKVGNRTSYIRDANPLTLGYNTLNQLVTAAANPQPGTGSTTLSGTVTDNLSPIKSLTINGTPVTPDASGNYSLNVTLNQGENIFTIVSEDMAGNISTKKRKAYFGVDTSWVYDLNGNLQRKQDIPTNTIDNFVQNSRNQLTQYQKLINGAPATTAAYQYDPIGRRTQKTVSGTTRKYVYDREDIILELDSSNTVVAKYTHGPGIDMPISMQRNGQTYYYHFDGLGSVVALTNSTGTVVQKYEYDAFGNILTEQDPNFENPYTFTARERDKESGLYFYRAR
ncbi:MAG: cysteine peptidase family C39 domain-containing protein, partial [bacterium]